MQHFLRELNALKRRVVEMGALTESMVADACRALLGSGSFDAVFANEPLLDRFQIEIDNEAIRLIAIHAPVARDLRFLVMIARITGDLERIGDQAVNTCEYMQLAGSAAAPPEALTMMMTTVSGMLHDALQAFEHDDTASAAAVMGRDEYVDALQTSILRDAFEHPGTDKESRARSMQSVLTARALERVADHATNLCEEVFYLVDGADVRHQT